MPLPERPLALQVLKLGRSRFVAPKLSRRKQAMIRNRAIENDKYFVGANLANGEWDPRWDPFKKSTVMRHPNLKKRLRTREEKVAEIEANLADMDRRIEEHHEQRIAARPNSFMERQMIKLGALKPGELAAMRQGSSVGGGLSKKQQKKQKKKKKEE